MLSKLLGLGAEQFAPPIVAFARTILLVLATAALGGALDGIDAVDWSDYLSGEQLPIAAFVVAVLRVVIEGALDQVRAARAAAKE